MSKAKRYSPEFRERAVRMLLDHKSEYDSEWAAMTAIAVKLGCTPEILPGCPASLGVEFQGLRRAQGLEAVKPRAH